MAIWLQLLAGNLGLVLVSVPAFAQFLPSVSDADANGRDIIHLVLNARADVRYVDQLHYHYHVRLYGDRR